MNIQINPAFPVEFQSIENGDTLHRRFSIQARLSPDAICANGSGASLTYAEVDSRSENLAHRLVRLGAGPNIPVAMLVSRTPDLLVAILGILKSGAAYLPLDAAYPPDRLAFLLSDSAAPLVVTDRGLACRLPPETQAQPVCLEDTDDQTRFPFAETLPETGGSDLAYIIYTSGSTGTPKGVLVTHSNVLRLFDSTKEEFGFCASDVWTLFHSYAFDFSVWEIWGALLYGGRLVVVPWATTRAPDRFRQLLADEGVTVLNQTPTAFRQLAHSDKQAGSCLPTLRIVIFGGESLDLRSLAPWFARYGDQRPQLVNGYGITETTVFTTFRPLSAADTHRGSVIGQPIRDLVLDVLLPSGEPAAVGETGEIWIGGAGVALGYLNRPDLTAERFVERNGVRFYRSGDLARFTQDGELEYVGRADRQIKLRGHRIELGEIEAVLADYPGVRGSCILVRQDTPDDERLAAYILCDQALPIDREALRAFAATRLPSHMVPAVVICVAEFPLTTNGKLDTAALARTTGIIPSARAQPQSPDDATEAVVAEVWGELLGISQGFDREANFFELGGHSLLLVRMGQAIRQRLGVSLSEVDLLESNTVRALASRIRLAAKTLSDPTLNKPTLAEDADRTRDRSDRQARAVEAMRAARASALSL